MIKNLILLKNHNMMDIKKVLSLWFINFLIKKYSVSGISTLANKFVINGRVNQNEQLAGELYKSIFRKF